MELSKCCGAPACVKGRTTHFYTCEKCLLPCDIRPDYSDMLDGILEKMADLTGEALSVARREGEARAWRIAIGIVKNHMIVSGKRDDMEMMLDIVESLENRASEV